MPGAAERQARETRALLEAAKSLRVAAPENWGRRADAKIAIVRLQKIYDALLSQLDVILVRWAPRDRAWHPSNSR